MGGPLRGQFGGYNNEGPCGHGGCTETVERGVDAMCGDNPHGGGEDSCGLFFCEAHLVYVPHQSNRSQRCEACAVPSDCELAGHPNAGPHPRYPERGSCVCTEVMYDTPPETSAFAVSGDMAVEFPGVTPDQLLGLMGRLHEDDGLSRPPVTDAMRERLAADDGPSLLIVEDELFQQRRAEHDVGED